MRFPRHPTNQSRAAALPPPREGYVELGRRFGLLSKTGDRDDAADESYLVRVWSGSGRFDWEKLLKTPLVVVLGEQGSGKSWEIEYQAAKLVAAGQFAFFLRLEELINQPMSAALGAPAAAIFNEWTHGTDRATFFLDSVDESKLNGAEDFYSALKHFREALPSDFAIRTRIILSSRVSEWHPETDGARVREYFGIKGRIQKTEYDDEEETRSTRPGEDGLLVVQINPLDREQVAALARAKNYPRVDEFLTALDQSHAWEFARRPLDVMALADFWQQNGRIGTLTELIEFDLVRNLRERRPRTGDPLTDGDARLGAEALAAGVIFCGEPSIKVSDTNLGGVGLDGRLCLPATFTQDQFDSLLMRPVLDGASFGRVRFHHRRVREYLAASWVNKRMAAGCSLDELDGLFFDRIGGRRVLRSSRGAVTAWLCAGGEVWNAAIRRWLLDASPSLNLRYGDPHALPLDYKRALLDKLVEAASTRGHLWLETDRDALSRLAEPALVPQIEAIIRNRTLADDLRVAMVEIVRHGRLAACLPLILELVASDETDELKTYAVAALRELNDQASLIRLAEIARHLPRVAPALTDLLVDALFPSHLPVDEFIELLRKTHDRNNRPPNLDWQIKSNLEERLESEHAGSLLERLLALLQTEPHFLAESGEPAVSQEFAWLHPLVTVTLVALLKKPALTTTETANAGAALALVGSLRERDQVADEKKLGLQKLTEAHPLVRRDFFWATVGRRRLIGLHSIDHPLDIFSRYDQLLEPSRTDVVWLIEDLRSLTNEADRDVALRHAMQWWSDLGRPWRLRVQIRRAVGSNRQLLTVLRALNHRARMRPLKRYYYLFERAYRHRRRQGERSYAWMMGHVRRWQFRYFLWKNLNRIARGEFLGAVNSLVHQAGRSNSSRLTVCGWSALEKKWGAPVVSATRAACKGFWRTYTPELPHESADSSIIPNALVLGLTGLQAAWTDHELDFATLSDTEVKVATRYAIREMNGFPPWLHPLAKSRPGPVGEIFAECISAEWSQPANRQRPHDSLQRLAWSGAPLLPAVRASVLTRLQTGDPTGQALELVVCHLLNSETPPLAELESIARSRLAEPTTTSDALALWFAIWLQLDPAAALDAWQAHVEGRPDANKVMVLAGATLHDRDFGHRPRIAAPQHLSVVALRRFLPLVYAHIRPADDIDRSQGGCYSPGARDYAQEFRGGLLRTLTDSRDPTAADTLMALSALPVFGSYRDRLLHLREENLRQQADRERWRAADVRDFTTTHETDPQTDRDLYRVVLKRVGDVKRDVEESDLGWRYELAAGVPEWRLRMWLASKLLERSRQRYTVPQESVIDQNQRPDIRIEHQRAGVASLELKWAQDWSFNQLMVALETQLLGQYLRAHSSRHGLLVLGMHQRGNRHWLPGDGRRLDFPALIKALKAKAIELESRHPEAKRLEVVGIDFREVSQR